MKRISARKNRGEQAFAKPGEWAGVKDLARSYTQKLAKFDASPKFPRRNCISPKGYDSPMVIPGPNFWRSHNRIHKGCSPLFLDGNALTLVHDLNLEVNLRDLHKNEDLLKMSTTCSSKMVLKFRENFGECQKLADLRYTDLHYTDLHYITLHHSTLHHTTPHGTTLLHTTVH